jgi:lysophospholipase L1-like esterase
MWTRYVAIGDSFTEGLDDFQPDGSYRGWADLLACELNQRQSGLLYANLAVRGRKMNRIINEQIPLALEMKPDLVSIAAGVNDALRKNWDPVKVINQFEHGIKQLRDADIDVLVIAFGDPQQRGSLATVRDRLMFLNKETVKIAKKYNCRLVDFWPINAYDHDYFWSDDRLHLSSAGHEATLQAVLHALDLRDESWKSPKVQLPDPPTWLKKRLADFHWLKDHMVPWAIRRAKGRSSGDHRTAKRPNLSPINIQDLPAK